MKSHVNFEDFCDSFTGGYKDNFTYEGKRALFDYLEEYEESTGEELELDPIAFCCEYTEYPDLKTAYKEYRDPQDPTDTNQQDDEVIRRYFQDYTTLVEFEGGIIIATF